MSVNWRDIQDKAVVFAHEWKDAKPEEIKSMPQKVLDAYFRALLHDKCFT